MDGIGRTGRKPALWRISIMGLFIVTAWPSAALAQLGGVVDDVKGAGGGAAGQAGEIANQVNDTIDDATGDVGDTIGDTGGTVGGVVGGDVGQTVGDTSGSVGDTIGSTGDGAGDTAGGVIAPIEDTVIPGDGNNPGSGNPTQPGRPGNPDRPGGSRGDDPSSNGGTSSDGRQGEGTRAGHAGTTETPGSATTSRRQGEDIRRISQRSDVAGAGRVLLESAKRFAFPLLLSILVGAFLVIQDRIDRKDPKLANAPLDDRDGYLSFS